MIVIQSEFVAAVEIFKDCPGPSHMKPLLLLLHQKLDMSLLRYPSLNELKYTTVNTEFLWKESKDTLGTMLYLGRTLL